MIFQQSDRLPDYATVFYAEVHAIYMAARYLTRQEEKANYIKIFTDNQAALQALDKPLITDCMVEKAAHKLQEAAKLVRSLKIVWVKAHAGNTGNELADALAKRGSELDEITIQDIPCN